MQTSENRFYVYGLFDRGVPFYIGKGKDSRAYDHIGEARRGSHLPVHKKIRSMNVAPDVRILCGELTEPDAYGLEEATIELVGRRSTKEGSLLNLSSGGRGGTAGYVVVLTPEQRERQLTALRSPEVRAKISAGNKGKIVSMDTRAKLSRINKGKVMSSEQRAKISATKIGICNYVPNVEQRKAISERLKGRPVSDETKKRISEGVKKRGGLTEDQAARQAKAVLVKVTCTHCDKIGARSIMLRWHFDKCKFRKT